jgi:RNA polymerase sigma factor (sigma-70 family)
MAISTLTGVLHRLRRLIRAEGASDPTDAGLLRQFVARREQTAFAALVERHGPMVLGVCRRLLRNEADTEDAFQATFLVLARKAGSIRAGESLGGWLHRVATHAALKARAAAAARRARERRGETMSLSDPADEAVRRELRPILDEELQGLPDRYRLPLVLCYLEERTHAQAARELGCALGSMARRLERGRELLRARLARRGVTLAAAPFAALLTEAAAPAAVPRTLADTAVRAALAFAGRQAASEGGAAALAENTLRALGHRPLRGLLLALTLTAVGAAALALHPWPADPPAAAGKAAAKGAEPPKGQADLYGDPLPPGALARLGTVRWRHGGIAWGGGPVFLVAFIARGKHLLTAGGDGRVRVWDAATGQELRHFDNSYAPAEVFQVPGKGARSMEGVRLARTALALSPDSRTLAAVGPDGILRLTDVASGKDDRQFRVAGPGGVNGLAFSPDGKTVFTRGADHVVRVWEVRTGKERGQLGAAPTLPVLIHYGVENSLAVAPDGKTLAAVHWQAAQGRWTRLLRLWDVPAGGLQRQIITGPRDLPTPRARMAFTPDGKSLACTEPDGTVRLYETATGKERRVLGRARPGKRQDDIAVTALAFAPDGKTLAGRSLDFPGIRLWDVPSGKELTPVGAKAGTRPIRSPVWPGVDNFPSSLAFSPDGRFLASGTTGGAVRLWEVRGGRERIPAVGHQGDVERLVVSADGRTLTTYGHDDTVRRWEVTTGKQTHCLSLPPRAAQVVLAPDGATLAFGAGGPTVRVWDVATGRERRSLPVPGRPPEDRIPGGYRGLAFAGDGKTLAVLDRGPEVRLWDAATGKPLRVLRRPGPGAAVEDVTFAGCFTHSPRGTALALAAPGVGRRADQGVIEVWDTATGKQLRRVEMKTWVNALAFSPDGRRLAAAHGDTVTVWDAASGKELARLPATASCLALSPDGALLATGLAGSGDGSVRLWELKTGKEAGCFRGHRGGILSLAFAPDSRKLFSGSLDTTILVWDVAARKR